MEDARHLTTIGAMPRVSIEQTAWTKPENAPDLCAMLNGLWERRTLYRIAVEKGEVVSFDRQSRVDPDAVEIVPLLVEGPTDEYATWYRWMVQNPAMYSFCRRATSPSAWALALAREQVRMPARIRAWLYRTIKHKGKP